MKRLYVVPVEARTLSGKTHRSPKYFNARGKPSPLVTCQWHAIEYGAARTQMLVCADTTIAQNTALIAQLDVTLLSDDLSLERSTIVQKIEEAQPKLVGVDVELFGVKLRTATLVSV